MAGNEELIGAQPASDEQIRQWAATKQKKAHPSCPCGFYSSTRYIRAHRVSCPAWKRLCEIDRAESDAIPNTTAVGGKPNEK